VEPTSKEEKNSVSLQKVWYFSFKAWSTGKMDSLYIGSHQIRYKY
jgi:hypothetical protein